MAAVRTSSNRGLTQHHQVCTSAPHEYPAPDRVRGRGAGEDVELGDKEEEVDAAGSENVVVPEVDTRASQTKPHLAQHSLRGV